MSDVRTQAQEVFRQVFDDPEIVLRDEMTADDIPGWDSLTHINLMVATEKRFKIKFATAEISKMKEDGPERRHFPGLDRQEARPDFMSSIGDRFQCFRRRVHRGRAAGGGGFLLAARRPSPPVALGLRQPFRPVAGAAQSGASAGRLGTIFCCSADTSWPGVLQKWPSGWLLSSYVGAAGGGLPGVEAIRHFWTGCCRAPCCNRLCKSWGSRSATASCSTSCESPA